MAANRDLKREKFEMIPNAQERFGAAIRAIGKAKPKRRVPKAKKPKRALERARFGLTRSRDAERLGTRARPGGCLIPAGFVLA